jgi:hypothetical protein
MVAICEPYDHARLTSEAADDIPALNVIIGWWWRPLSGADSGGGS